MTYFRRQPWRPRSAWLGARAGARRRGFRQDELYPAVDGLEDGVDVVMAVAGETAFMDDTVLVEAVTTPAVQGAFPARVDVSGLLAIGAMAPKSSLTPQIDEAMPMAVWHARGAHGDEDVVLSRHSA